MNFDQFLTQEVNSAHSDQRGARDKNRSWNFRKIDSFGGIRKKNKLYFYGYKMKKLEHLLIEGAEVTTIGSSMLQ